MSEQVRQRRGLLRRLLNGMFGSFKQRGRQKGTLGCLPAVILVAGGLLLFFNLVTYTRPRPWVTDVRTWRLTGRLTVSLGLLSVLQFFVIWMQGLIAAVGGVDTVDGSIASLGKRLRTTQGQLLGATMSAVLVRVVMLALVTGGIWALSWSLIDSIGSSLSATRTRILWENYGILISGTILLIVLYLLLGPILRTRYSVMLGALAATYHADKTQQRWAAISTRLGAGLLGMLTLVWGGAVIILLGVNLYDPFWASSRYTPPTLFPSLPDWVLGSVSGMVTVCVFVFIYLTGQIVLPFVLKWRIVRRLEKQQAAANSQQNDPGNSVSA